MHLNLKACQSKIKFTQQVLSLLLLYMKAWPQLHIMLSVHSILPLPWFSVLLTGWRNEPSQSLAAWGDVPFQEPCSIPTKYISGLLNIRCMYQDTARVYYEHQYFKSVICTSIFKAYWGSLVLDYMYTQYWPLKIYCFICKHDTKMFLTKIKYISPLFIIWQNSV